MSSDERPPEWEVVVRRRGRFVTAYAAGTSQYAAKKVARRLEPRYDLTHTLEVQPVGVLRPVRAEPADKIRTDRHPADSAGEDPN